ncbi:unnamed protein product [Kuraishia capsulata CBS 1993]|uniref:[histone H3]-trimethyl-L-lysine(9) demethylase n=1 Tax=Kuraishia capsulata CBS 1993 TaxID=1382522 RepID=W6MHF8_9ASCO|nr:uncharacterized protein KUCA_T00001381001 [Kuraishia capsulata CBS 1993]CDK25411.1 unnamed protein product [Kuraishia capsulata CBS 1993]
MSSPRKGSSSKASNHYHHHQLPSPGSDGLSPRSAPSTRATTPDRDSDSNKLFNKYTELLDISPHHVEGGVPVFKPTIDEFKDFYLFQKSINRYGMQSGIVKVIPPQEWIDSLPEPDSEVLSSVKFQKPISQQISGTNGQYAIQNIEKQKNYNLIQWKKLSMESNFLLPVPRGENREKPKISEEEKFFFDKAKKATKNEITPSLFENFPYNIDTSMYTPEKCDFLEQQYWKTLTFSSPFYGADSLGSLFPGNFGPWNVAQLPNLLDYLPEKLPGVNDAYLYGGLWKATFSWHTEDQDLYSINYLHFGAPKQWYSIPQDQHEKFYNAMAAVYPEDYKHCSEFLRHKTFLVSPAFLSKHGIHANKIVHREKEFIITYPYGYHSGFNYGYNLAESVNFALEEWLDIGVMTKKCECVSDSVGIDMRKFMKRLNGDYSITDDELEEEDEEDEVVDEMEEDTTIQVKKQKDATAKMKEVLPAPAEKVKSPPSQCVLCPKNLSKKLLKLKSFELLEVVDFARTKKVHYAHRLCAQFIPELQILSKNEYMASVEAGKEPMNIESEAIKSVSAEPDVNPKQEVQDDRDIVLGFPNIPTARRRLKCSVCRLENPQRSGGCFQCGLGKCARSFHAMCALGAGILLCNPSEGGDADGNEGHRCKLHRPRNSTYSDEYVKSYLDSIQPGKYIQISVGSEWFAGEVICNNRGESSVEVSIFSSKLSDRLEIMYENVLIPSANSLDISAKNISLHAQRDEHTRLLAELEKNKLKQQSKSEEQEAKKAQRKLDKMKKLDEKKRIAELAKQKRLLEDFDVTGYSFPSLSKTVDGNFIVEVVTSEQSKEPKEVMEDSARWWYYKLKDSTEQIARYCDNAYSNEPNDPIYLRFLKKRAQEANRKKRKAEQELLQTQAALKVPKLETPSQPLVSILQFHSFTPPPVHQVQPILAPRCEAFNLPEMKTFVNVALQSQASSDSLHDTAGQK